MAAIAVAQVVLAAGVSAAYLTIAVVLLPRVTVAGVTAPVERTFRLGGLALLIGGGLMHLNLAIQAVGLPETVGAAELVFQVIQFLGGWALIFSTVRLLEVRVSRRSNSDEVAAGLLRTENSVLAESNEDLERFADIISHDLREPLRSVSGFAQLLERRCGDQLDERADGYVQSIVASTERMRGLLDGVLAYSRVSGTALELDAVDLNRVVAAVRASLADSIVESDATIEVAGTLPSVLGDPMQIEQLVLNLVSNGIKYVDDGVRPRITISARAAGGEWVVSIADNGIGISPEARERIFEMFSRLHLRDEYAGTGVGLAICERIAARHGGRIRVLQSAHGGSEFQCFLMPVETAPSELTRHSDGVSLEGVFSVA